MNTFPLVVHLKVMQSLSPGRVNLSLDLGRSNVCNCFSKMSVCLLYKAYDVSARFLTV